MSKSIFISCVYEDSHRIKNIRKWAKKGQLGDVTLTSETVDKRHEGDEAIIEHLQKKIKGAAVILVLIGQDTHNHFWIKNEVEYANSFHKKIVCVRVPDTDGDVPQILKKYHVFAFEPNVIRDELYALFGN